MFNLVICDTRVADSLQSECFHWDLVSMTKPSPFHPFPRHGSSPSHARCYAVHPAPSTWVSPKRSPKPWRCLRVQRLEPQQMGEKLGTDVSPTFPNRCIFRLIILKHVCFRGVYDIDILDFFWGETEIKVFGPLITWQAQGQPAISLSGWQDMYWWICLQNCLFSFALSSWLKT